MARPKKQGLDYFPLVELNWRTSSKMGCSDFKKRYIAYRNFSSSFISRPDVRSYLLKKYGHKCALCGCSEKLQIDHIVSVYLAAKNRISIELLNSESNLQVLCASCNAKKCPDEL